MSGDVQPRKRKDKKRKKDETGEQIPSQPQAPSSNNQNEDVNIHVHKEDGTGGGICAKVIFFLLFSALVILIGLIITEHRGLTDLDTVDQESRFSQLFEGWIDNNDDEGDHVVSSLNDDHGEDENESQEIHQDDEHDEEDDEKEPDEKEDEEISEEISQANDEEDEDEEQDEAEDDEEEEEETIEEDVQTLESEEHDDDSAYESELKDVDEDEVSDENDDEEQEVSKDTELSTEDEIEDVDNNEDDENSDDNDDNVSKDVASEEDNVKNESPEKESEEVKEEEQILNKDEEDKEETEDNESILEEKQEEEKGNEDQKNSKSINIQPGDKPEESDSDKQSDDVETYEYEHMTNKDDFKIKEKIDEAQKNIKNNTAYAIKLFDVLLQNYSSSPRSIYGKAQALDVLADKKRSNDLLQKAIAHYLRILDLENVPDNLFEAAAERCINRMRFIGNYNRAVDVHKKLIARFPQDVKHLNQLVVTYLTINRVNRARMILQETLSKYPNDGFALVHYGFILKTVDNNLIESVSYLRRGIATKAPGVIDGRFYFHLGDALSRLGKNPEAMKVYEDGVQHKLFLSKYQRSLYNVARLMGKPWWEKKETPYANLYDLLERNWERIRDEGLSVLGKNDQFQSETENLKDTGDWKQFELFARGQKNTENCKKCPVTCRILESIPDAKGCRRGQTKFSVMHPGTHVWPHCGPTNCRLRVHLGLNVPAHTYIRVAGEIRSWENGKILIFDDSFEHEVWHNGTTFRLVLIVDVWHPELTPAEKRTLSPI